MNFPKRKHPRLKKYDYSLPGYYYVTVHIEHNAPLLSRITAGTQMEPPAVILTAHGVIVQRQLLGLEQRYENVIVDKYVIMPTHIHVILRLLETTAGASPRPTISEVVGAFKSLTTRECNRRFETPGKKLFQTSFYETVLRDEPIYQACWNYIEGNPAKWLTEPEDI